MFYQIVKIIFIFFLIFLLYCDNPFEPTQTKLSITVFEKVDSDMKGVPQVQVSTNGMSDRLTDTNGIVVYEDIESGNREFVFSKTGFQTKTETINISKGKDNEAQVEILRSQAILSYSPTSLDFSTNLDSLHFEIKNTGEGDLQWELSENYSWLSIKPQEGTNEGRVWVYVNRSGLNPDKYNGEVLITSNGGTGQVQVLMEVLDTSGPELSLHPDILDFGNIKSDKAESSLLISNKGQGILDWSLTTDDNWVAASITQGQIAAGGIQNIKITIFLSGLEYKNHESTINVTSNGGSGTVSIKVNYFYDINNLSFTFMGEISTIGDLGSYSNPALADLDNDGDLDIVVGESNGNLYAFYNAGNRTNHVFLRESNNFNLNFVPGSYPAPAFCDIDSDGDFDLFIGLGNGTVKCYRNTGIPGYPQWQEANNLTLGIGDIGSHAQPAFADLDGDGDLDLFIGEQHECRNNGFENIGSSTEPLWSPNSDFTNFSVRTYDEYSSPSFTDLDFDGDSDFAYLWMDPSWSTKPCVVSFYERTNTSGAPTWRHIKTYQLYNYPSCMTRLYPSLTFADVDGDNDFDMIVGTYYGMIYWFKNNAY